jgi:hypothetical protein
MQGDSASLASVLFSARSRAWFIDIFIACEYETQVDKITVLA